LLVAAWLAAFAGSADAQTKARVVIRGQVFTVDVADTPALQVRGLSGRPVLGPDEGMLFVYEQEGDHRFWMRDMLIPIDMIWLRNTRVVHIEDSVPPPKPGTSLDDLPLYSSSEPANLVLELAAGRARALGLKPGDRVTIEIR
jgi:uncharacterized membrane protein (UPF0127 family)